jgi:hypothetical protein
VDHQAKQPRELRAEAEAAVIQARHDASAEAAARRFDPSAMVGQPAGQARAYYLEQGYPVVTLEHVGGSSVASLMRERVRLTVDGDGVVVSARLG